MTTDAITNWLKAPAILPDDAKIDTALREWPWFVPVRLMETVREHRNIPFSLKTLAALQLYTDSWLPAYSLLAGQEVAEQGYKTADQVEAAAIHNEITVPEEPSAVPAEESIPVPEEPFIQPVYTEDYFRYEGIKPTPSEPVETPEQEQQSEQPQSLMVVMSFAEWLNHFKIKTQKEQEEAKEKSALRSMWQQEKLASALQDEPEEIPEDVFEMAVSSITKEDDIVSEPLAQIYERQEKWGAAAEMYKKLALKYPAKSAYFASRAEAAKKRLL